LIENIKCDGYKNTISNVLLKLKNIENVSINDDLETITIKGTLDRDIVLKKLTELGYREKGNNSLISKAKSYASCAIGKVSDKT